MKKRKLKNITSVSNLDIKALFKIWGGVSRSDEPCQTNTCLQLACSYQACGSGACKQSACVTQACESTACGLNVDAP